MPYSLPPDGEWTRDPSWDEVLAAALNRREAEIGLEHLRRAISPSWVKALGKDWHPLVDDYGSPVSRFALIELGVAIDRYKPAQISQRLRNPVDFDGTSAELRSGLVLQALGAALTHEPLGRGKKGPDWLTRWDDGTNVSVEVKCPLYSKRSELMFRAAVALFDVFRRCLHDKPNVRPDTGTWFDFKPTYEAILQVLQNGSIGTSIVEKLAGDAADIVGSLPWPVPDGTYAIGNIAVIVIKRGAEGGPQFHFMGGPGYWEYEYEAKRLYDDLQDAAGQLVQIPDIPSLVVIDADRDATVFNLFGDAGEIINTEPWATHLAGVLFLFRDFPDGTPDCCMYFVPGRQDGACHVLLQSGSDCPRGGWHAYSGVFRRPECSGWAHMRHDDNQADGAPR